MESNARRSAPGRRRYRIPFALSCALLLAAAALAIAGGPYAAPGDRAAYAQSEPTVAIGALVAGPGEEFDDSNRTRAMQYAVDRFNERNAGFDLALQVVGIERGGEPAGLARAYANGTGPLFYVGPTTSQGIANLLGNGTTAQILGDIVLVSPSSEAPQLAVAGDRIFRLAVNVERQGAILAGEMESAGIDSLVIAARDDVWGRQLAASASRAAAERGIGVLATVPFGGSGDPAHWRGVVAAVAGNATAGGGAAAGGARVGVLFAGYGASYSSMAAAAAGNAALENTAWFAPSTAVSASSPLLREAGTVRDFSASVGLTVLEENVPDGAAARGIEAHVAGGAPLPFYDYSSYDSVFVLGGAIAAAGGPNATAQRVAEEMPNAAMDYTGAIGDIILDANGDLLAPDNFTVWRVDRATGELARGASTGTPVSKIGALMALGYQNWPDDLTLAGLRLAAADHNAAASAGAGTAGSFAKLVAYNITGRDALDVLRDAHDGGAGPAAYIGPTLSSNLERVYDYSEESGVILFSPASEAESLAIGGDNTFRLAVSTDKQAAVMAGAMAGTPGVSQAVTVVRDDVWGRDLNATLASELGLRGVDVAASVPFAPGGGAGWARAAPDIAAAVEALPDRSAALVAFVGVFDDLDGLAAAAEADPAVRASLTGIDWFVATSAVTSIGFPAIPNPVTASFATDANATSIDNDVVFFGNEKREAFEAVVPGTWFYEFAAYDALRILAAALGSIADSGGEGGAAALRDAIPRAAEEYEGILGDIALNSRGDLLTPDRFAIWRVVNGSWADTGTRIFTPVADVGALVAGGGSGVPPGEQGRLEAMRLAVDDFNRESEAAGGPVYLNLVPVRVGASNGSGGPQSVANAIAAASAGDGGIVHYVGPSTSGAAESALAYAKGAGAAARNGSGIVLIAHSYASAPGLAAAGDPLFRLTAPDAGRGAVLAGLLADAGVTDLVVAARDDAWGRSVDAEAAAAMAVLGGSAAAADAARSNGSGVSISRVAFGGAGDDWARVAGELDAAVSAAAGQAAPRPAGKAAVLFAGFEGDFAGIAAQVQRPESSPLAGVWWLAADGVGNGGAVMSDERSLALARQVNLTSVALAPPATAAGSRLDPAVLHAPSAYDSVYLMGLAMRAAYGDPGGVQGGAAGLGIAAGIPRALDGPGPVPNASAVRADLPTAAAGYRGALGGGAGLDANGDLLRPPRAYAVYEIGAGGAWERAGSRLAVQPVDCSAGAGVACIAIGEAYVEGGAGAGRPAPLLAEVHGAYALAADDYNAERAADGSPLRVALQRVAAEQGALEDAVRGAYGGGAGPAAYLAPALGGAEMALEDLADETGIVLASPVSTATSPSSLARPDGLFRLLLADRYEAALLAAVARGEGVRTIVPVAAAGGAYGPNYDEELRLEAARLGMDVLGPIYLPRPPGGYGPAADAIRERVAGLAADGIDPASIGVAVVSAGGGLDRLAGLAAGDGLLASVKWLEPGALFPPEPVAGNGTLALASAAPLYSMSWDVPEDGRLERFRADMAAANGFGPRQQGYAAYDSVRMLAGAISLSAGGAEAAAAEAAAAAGYVPYTGAAAAARMHDAAAGMDGLLGGGVRLDQNGDRVSPSDIIVWRYDAGAGAWADTGSRASLPATCGVSVWPPDVSFGEVAPGGRSAPAVQTVAASGTLPLDTLRVGAMPWLSEGAAEELPAGATEIALSGAGGGGTAWQPLSRGFAVGEPGGDPLPGLTGLQLRLSVPADKQIASAVPVSQAVTYEAECLP